MVKIQYYLLIITIFSTFGVKSENAEVPHQPLSSAIASLQGPVTATLESLVYNTASIADEIVLQMNSKLERTTYILYGSIEVLIANALEQLAQPIYQANRRLSNVTCNTTWTIVELRSRINSQLSVCTKELNDLLETYKLDANNSISALENYVDDIGNLSSVCRGVEVFSNENMPQSFAKSTNCFIENMSDLNEQISKELDTIRLLLLRTHQLSQQAETQAHNCIADLVGDIVKLIDEELKDC